MSHYVLDATTSTKLLNLKEPTEFRDESGRVIGHFHPIEPSVEQEPRSPFSRDDLESRRRQRTGRPLAEILERLGES